MSNRLDIPVWVLNLERDSEKRFFMQQQLEELAIDYELINAVDKETLTPEDLQRYSAQNALKSIGRELSRGEIGCALSHAKMWERIVKERHPEVLILEDDVRIGRSLAAVLANRHRFPADYELINLSTDAPQVPFGDYITDIYRVSNHQRDALSTLAYMITRKGAGKLLDKVYPIRWPADELTARTYITGLVSYGIYPKVAVIGDDFESGIWKNETVPKLGLVPRAKNVRHVFRTWRQSLQLIGDIIRYG